MEGRCLLILSQQYYLIIDKLPVQVDVGLDDLVHMVDVATRQWHFEISLVSACLLVDWFT